MRDVEIKIAWQGKSDCQVCAIRSSALFAELNEDDFSKIHLPISDIKFDANSSIYKQGDDGEHVFTLREGFVKLLRVNEDGTERIVRLIKQGDLFGMEALLSNKYENAAISLSSVYLCKIPVHVLKTLGENSPRLHRQMMRKWGEALSESQSWFSEINTGRAELRLARFLLRLSYEANGFLCAPLFKREDMGLMMDLKLETVSRTLSLLTEQNFVSDVTRSSLVIKDENRLKALCQQGSL